MCVCVCVCVCACVRARACVRVCACARVCVYVRAPSLQDNTHYGLCCTSCGTLAGTINYSMGPLRGFDPAIENSFLVGAGTMTRTQYLPAN